MSFPLYFVLFAYFIFLAIFVVFSIVHVYHIVATASLTFASFVMSLFVAVITVLTLFWTVQSLAGTDFTTEVRVFDGSWFSQKSNDSFVPSNF